MRRFAAWMRVIAPAERVVGCTVASCLAVGVLMATAEVIDAGVGPGFAARFDGSSVRRMVTAAAYVGACAYGTMRAYYFHPLCREKHYRWLCATPWSASHRLPFGPVTLVPQDVIWLTVLAACAAASGLAWSIGACAVAVGSYLAVITALLVHAGPYWAGYALLMLAGLLLQLWVWRVAAFLNYVTQRGAVPDSLAPWFPWSVGAVGLALLALSQYALRRQLHAFPWPADRIIEVFPHDSAGKRQSSKWKPLGWPLDALRSDIAQQSSLSTVERATLAICIAWIAMVLGMGAVVRQLIAMSTDARAPNFQVIPALPMCLTIVLPLFQLADRTVLRTRAPISTLGRFALRTPWIPRFDQVWITPCASIVILLAGAWAIVSAPGLAEVVAFTATAVAMLIYFFGQPSEAGWHLAGAHRLVRLVPSLWKPVAKRDRFFG